MPRHVATSLMFDGTVEEVMRFYLSLFKGSQVNKVIKYGPAAAEKKDRVKKADFTIAGHRLVCCDSSEKHPSEFTQSICLFVECEDEAELDQACAALAEGGEVLIQPGYYQFSRRFAWVK